MFNSALHSSSLRWIGSRIEPWTWVLEVVRNAFPELSILDSEPPADADELCGWVRGGSRLLFAIDNRFDPLVPRIENWAIEYDSKMNSVSPSRSSRKTTGSADSLKKKSASQSEKSSKRAIGATSLPTWQESVTVMLGEDWAGHRRTRPMLESTLPLYWYQAMDRLLPWLSHKAGDSIWSNLEADRPSDRLTPRVAQILRENSRSVANEIERAGVVPTSILVVSDSRDARELWFDLLSQMHCTVVATCAAKCPALMNPNWVLFDFECEPRLQVREGWWAKGAPTRHFSPCQQNKVASLRDRYPGAKLIFVDSFPRWQDWNWLKELGVQSFLPFPSHLEGLEYLLQRWNPPAPSGTIVFGQGP